MHKWVLSQEITIDVLYIKYATVDAFILIYIGLYKIISI